MTETGEWAVRFKQLLFDNLKKDLSYDQASAAMRKIVRSKMLTHFDLHDNPERFFLAHRLLAEHAVALGPGNWIRFTVHYNLCVGSVLAVGNQEQVQSLQGMQDKGQLGCFGLTERFAGVNSGMFVEVTATYDRATEAFVLQSPDKGGVKNWISQGLTADKALVLADLVDGQGKHRGPHAFFIDMRQHGRLAAGITVGDMGRKTIGNDLDNAWIQFDGLRVPRSTLLSRYADVSKEGVYTRKGKLTNMEMVGQRLFTGRVAVAQAALQFSRNIFRQTLDYADNKRCWAPKGQRPTLSQIPQLKAIFKEGEAKLARLERFTRAIEAKLCAVLREDAIPSARLQRAIAVAKIQCVETSIDLCHRLKQEVGSYALMESSGFISLDFLSCCKFAEGDSRILLLKLARDTMRAAAKGKQGARLPADEMALCLRVGAAVKRRGQQEGFNKEWRSVYALAWKVANRTLYEWTGLPSSL